VFLNARIAGSEKILLSPTVYMVLNTKSATVLIKSNIIGRWYNVVRLTVKANTKQIATFVYSRSIDSTESGM